MNKTDLLAMRMMKTGIITPFSSPIMAEQAAIGLQAQNNTQAELNIMLRTAGQLTQSDLRQLYQKQELVRSWGQRWTLHLYTIEDWWLVLSTRQHLQFPVTKDVDVVKFNQAFEMVTAEFENNQTVAESRIKEIIAPFTVAGDAMIYNINQRLILERRAVIDAGSGNSNRTFISTTELDNQLLDFKTAVAELLTRYFTTFAPATLADFIHWSGLKISQVRPIFNELIVDQGTVFEIDGELYYDLQPIEIDTNILHDESFIVAQFDSLLTGYVPKDWFIPNEHISDMWSKNGLLRAPIIIDGIAKGKWSYQITGKNIKFEIELWNKITKKQQEQLNCKFEQVAKFFDKNIKSIDYR